MSPLYFKFYFTLQQNNSINRLNIIGLDVLKFITIRYVTDSKHNINNFGTILYLI